MTWSETGLDNVKGYINAYSKPSITVMASVKADGTKLPLFIIVKGKPERIEKNLGDIELLFILSGLADDLQPLDLLVFGSL